MDEDGKLGLKTREKTIPCYNAPVKGHAATHARWKPCSPSSPPTVIRRSQNCSPADARDVVEALVGEAFNRLDVNAQKVMQALAVYNRPVTPAAVDYLLAAAPARD